MNEQARFTPKALRLYLELREYPIRCDEIRKRMRDEMFRRGVLRIEQFEEEVRQKAIASQAREKLVDPVHQNSPKCGIFAAPAFAICSRTVRPQPSAQHFRNIVLEVLENKPKRLFAEFQSELAPGICSFPRLKNTKSPR
jgi:hypothetical protein